MTTIKNAPRFITLSMIDRSVYDENESGVARETTKPAFVQPSMIRCFYDRKDGRAGSRITFNDGQGFAVSEWPEQIIAIINGTEIPAARVIVPVPVIAAPAADDTAENAAEGEALAIEATQH